MNHSDQNECEIIAKRAASGSDCGCLCFMLFLAILAIAYVFFREQAKLERRIDCLENIVLVGEDE